MSERWVCSVCGHIERGAAPPTTCPSCGAPFTAFVRQVRNPLARLRNIEIAEARPAGHRYVIVGNSAAGRSAARAIGALAGDARITIISEETADLYARPMLPDLIGGAERDTVFGVAEGYPAQDIEMILGDGAVSIDANARVVTCAGGREVSCDSLLLATGSAPVQIPWPGSDAQGIAYFRSFADARRIAAMAGEAEHAVVVGGGLLGLEFVRAFHMRGLRVTHLIRDDRVGAPGLDETAGAIIQDALLDWGVEVALGEEVVAFRSEDGHVRAVETSRDRAIECDLVGVAIGARPRLELAEDIGLDCGRGILVDSRFRTSAPGIYAAGDVAEAHDRVRGERRVTTSWRNAQEQGEAAGIFMAGGAGEYPGAVAVNFQLAAGIPFCALGISNPEDPAAFDIEVTADRDARTCRKRVLRDGALVGAALVGDLAEAAEIEQELRGDEDGDETRAARGRERPSPAEPAVDVSAEPTRREVTPAMHKMSEENLWASFAGESQAHMKYKNFADKAAEEGKVNVARLFRAASFAEQVHASHHLEVLEGIAGTAENLAAAAEGENFEITEMYPAYLAVADEQAEDEAYESFNYAMEAEKTHYELYQRAGTAVDAGGDATFDAIHVCGHCGYTLEGEAPEKCPVCGSPRKEFVKF